MEKFKEILITQYGIIGDVVISKVDAGFLSDNYRVQTTTDIFFLKGYRKADSQRVAEIHKVKAYFSSHGIPVILPRMTLTQETYFICDGMVFALFPFVKGIHHNRQNISDPVTKEIATLCAKMHQISTNHPLLISNTFKFWSSNKLKVADEILEKINLIKEKSDFDILALRNIHLKCELIVKELIPHESLKLEPFILLHGDFQEQNIFFDEQGKVKYVFDFGETKMGLRGQELWRSADYMFLNGNFSDTNINKVILFLKTYNDRNPISKEQLTNAFKVSFLMNIHSFWVESEHYLKNNTKVDHFLEVRSTVYFAEHKEEFLNRVLQGVYGT